MTFFLVLGITGLALIALSLLVGDLLDGAVPALEADWISTAVIGGFVSAFGFGAAATEGADAPLPVSLVVGAAAGVVVGWLAWRLTRLLKDAPSDGTVSIGDSVGRLGRVVTPIPAGGYGVVRVSVGGHTLTCNAVSTVPIDVGAEVTVTEALSPTAVRVAAVWKPDA